MNTKCRVTSASRFVTNAYESIQENLHQNFCLFVCLCTHYRAITPCVLADESRQQYCSVHGFYYSLISCHCTVHDDCDSNSKGYQQYQKTKQQ